LDRIKQMLNALKFSGKNPGKDKLKESLFFLSLFFFLLIALFSVFPCFADAKEASFFVSPSKGSFGVGETFRVSVFVKSEGAFINAAQSKITFPPNLLRVSDISKSGSIFTLWVQEPSWSNSKGEVSFGGGLPSPGFRGKSGKVVTISFQGKAIGKATVSFKEEMILENSAFAPNIFSFSNEGKYIIYKTEVVEIPQVPKTPEISSLSHPRQDRWYSNNNPEFKWDLEPNVTDVSFSLNQKPGFNPGNESDGLFGSKGFNDIEDGIWYFHLKVKNNNGWSDISHFEIRIDTKPPHAFEIISDNEGDATNPTPLLFFEAADDTSGISYYELKIGDKDSLKVIEGKTAPYRVAPQLPGDYPVTVKAYDYAQNFSESKTRIRIESIERPEITIWPSVFRAGKEVMYVEGTAIPDCDVIVFFKKDNETVKEWEIQSNERGEWSLKESGLFRSGDYELSARTRDERGAVSDPSDPRFVKVMLSGITIGPWVIGFKTLLFLLLILLILILIGIVYLLWRIRETKDEIVEETKDLKKKFYKEFHELEQDIEKELEILKWLRSKRRFTKKEEKRENDLLKNLADVKKVFKKELKDIEDIIR